MEAVVARVEQALAQDRLEELEPLMLSQVALAVPQAPGRVLSRQEALDWLQEHYAEGVSITSWQHVEQFGLLEIITEGWPDRPPIQTGKLTFNLRRFDSTGVQDALRGRWQIDGIIPD